MTRRAILALAASGALFGANDEREWRDFVDWLKKQPPSAGNVWQMYRTKLAGDGLSPTEINSIIEGLTRQAARSDELSSILFDRIYSSNKPEFQTAPNGFLVECTGGLKPGQALDIGMGQGRNSLYLASKGWEVTGFDVAEEGLSQARAAAKRAGVKLKAVREDQERFDYGKNRWDLIAMIYTWVPLTDTALLGRIRQALRPGGLLVFENFLVENGKPPANNPGAAWPNGPLQAFGTLRVLRYEDRIAPSDWAPGQNRIARLLASHDA